MTKAEFETLVTEYGNLSFKCGNFDPDDVLEKYRVTPFRELAAQCAAAKQAVLDAYDKKETVLNDHAWEKEKHDDIMTKTDILIAEKVMGWKLFSYEQDRYAESPEDYEDASRNDGWYWSESGTEEEAWCWSPTTHPIDSKLLRKKLAERWDWLMGSGQTRIEEPPFGFSLYEKHADYGSDTEIAAAEAATEEMAVALCALKAYGLEISK